MEVLVRPEVVILPFYGAGAMDAKFSSSSKPHCSKFEAPIFFLFEILALIHLITHILYPSTLQQILCIVWDRLLDSKSDKEWVWGSLASKPNWDKIFHSV